MPKKKPETPESIESSSILPVSIVDEMKHSFIEYSMSVITARALPDIRDGLKPVHRRILYSMHEKGLHAGAKFRKSATVVGDVLGKYHPHGDTSVYDSMVNMAQDFSYRYPLIWGQGNFGSLDGDGAAAYRYTEAKMAKVSKALLDDIEKDTVNFRDNFDGTTKEPVVLPAAVPNLLLNGVLGIAVGMATNIPPHNLGEVVDATVALIDNPQCSIDDLLKHIQGPDFPLGGIAYDRKAIATAYATGRGGVVTRGNAEIKESKAGKFQIIISSLPFRTKRDSLVVKIADLVRDKKLKGIKDLRDESTDVTRIVIDLKHDANPQRVLKYIYKYTELESTFNYNMTALVDGVPQTVSLKDIIKNFVLHRREVVRRRTEFELAKAEARAHILEGLKKALDNIDKVIATIKKSKDTPTAKENLIKQFTFTDIQAQAILDMRLQKLAGLERKKIEDELKEKLDLIKGFKALLASEKKMLGVIKDELLDVKEKYSDDRRTKIMKGAVNQISDEDLVVEKETVVIFTAGGYINRTDPSEYKKQNRGGKGVGGMNTKEEDVVTQVLSGNTHSDLLFFSSVGKVYSTKMYDIPEAKRSTRGKSVNNYIGLTGEERVQSILSLPKDVKKEDGVYFVFITKKGIAKKVEIDQFSNIRSSGLIALNLKDGDELLGVRMVRPGDDIILVTRNGQSIRFPESDLRPMGRTAAGVKGVALKKDDQVVSSGVVRTEYEKPELLVVMEHGYGKRTDLSEYKSQSRGGSGIKAASVTEKTGRIASAKVISGEETGLIAISAQSQIIRTDISDISVLGRATQGVRIMKLNKGDQVASITLI
ncbi:DNA gyrase subunit A [Candidatus Nomurabacteria bacterium]|nr:DNA gyrase subunit A [Candidatus Nomurabacteria bacterium]